MNERKAVTRKIKKEYRKASKKDKTVIFKPEKKVRPKNRLGKPVYTWETVETLAKIRAFYGGKRGAYLSVILRQNIDALVGTLRFAQ